MSTQDAKDLAELAKFTWLGTWFSLVGLFIWGRILEAQANACELNPAVSDCGTGSVPGGLYIVPVICGAVTVLLLVAALSARGFAKPPDGRPAQPAAPTSTAKVTSPSGSTRPRSEPSSAVELRHGFVPNLGDGVTEVKLEAWAARVGDTVKDNDPVAIIEVGSSRMYLRSPYDGRMAMLMASQGETVKVGAPLFSVAVRTNAAAPDAPPAPPSTPRQPDPGRPGGVQLVPVPHVGEGLSEAKVVTWNVAYGDTVGVGDLVALVETELSQVHLVSPYAGTVNGLLAAEGQTVQVGSPLFAIDTGPKTAAESGEAAQGGSRDAHEPHGQPDHADPGPAGRGGPSGFQIAELATAAIGSLAGVIGLFSN